MTESAQDATAASGGPRPLSGRRALVTGGGRGVGAAITLALAAAGADIAITYVRDEEKAAATAAAAEALGGKCRAYRGSVADPDDNRAVVEAVVADFGGLDLLVSNAGIASRGRTVANTDAAELEKVLRVHALGPHELCRLALPHLRRRPRSDIVFISSVAASRFMPGGAPYAMGKAAAEALAHTLAREERAAGVHVNIVAPASSTPRWAPGWCGPPPGLTTSARWTRPRRSAMSARRRRWPRPCC